MVPTRPVPNFAFVYFQLVFAYFRWCNENNLDSFLLFPGKLQTYPKMSSILQLQAQYESLATQYRLNQAEVAACSARRDEGMHLKFVSR